MSNLPKVIEVTDISEIEVAKINEFKENGLPGIAQIAETQLGRMYNMYISGSTYSQISRATGLPRVAVLYLSHAGSWYESKQQHMVEIQESMKNRVVESKIKNQDFLLLVVQAYRKKIEQKLTTFLATDEESHMNDIDLKELGQVMKTIEMINGLDSDGKGKKGKAPTIGLNIGENGVNIEKTGDNKVSITPKESSIGDMLKKHADEQRELERKKALSISNNSDIVSVQGAKNEQ